MKVTFKDLLLVVFILVFIIGIFLIVQSIKTQGAKCYLYPMQYGVNRLSEVNKREVVCSCSLIGEGNAEPLIFQSSSKSRISSEGEN